MSLHDRGAGMPTVPRIPQQRSTTRDDASLRREPVRAVRPAVPVVDGATSRWLAALRVATGIAFCWAGLQLATGGVPAGWLLVAGLAGTGVAVTLGVGLRPAAVIGTALLLTMWIPGLSVGVPGDAAGGPGAPFGSFPFAAALVLVVLAVTYAGRTWGLGAAWSALPVVRRHPWLI